MLGRIRLGSTLFGLLLLVSPVGALAMPLNIDFGDDGPAPSSAFGAASGQAGHWNNITDSIVNSGVLDTSGNATAVRFLIVANSMGGIFPIGPESDGASLMEDNFLTGRGGSWSVFMDGLTDGLYHVFLYDPHHNGVGTGSGSVNGVAFGHINGTFTSGTFTEGVNYHRLTVDVVGGLLNMSGSVPDGFSGLAGMQLVPVGPVPVPEPASLLLVGPGILGLLARARRQRKALTQD